MPFMEPGHTPWDVIMVALFVIYLIWQAWDKRRTKERERNKHEENKVLIAQVLHEVKPNSGKSMADGVNRIEADVKELSNELSKHIKETEPHTAWIEKEMEYERRLYAESQGRRKRRSANGR